MNINHISSMILNTELKQRIALGLSAALAILICFTFLYACWQWRTDWVLAHQDMPQAPAMTTTDNAATMIAAIPDEHLFGKSFTSGNMPITNLQLRVTGIVKTGNKPSNTHSKAYISISGQPSKIYQAGDSLPYGVKIYDITPDAVILENDGHLEKLPLPREKLQFKMRNTEGSL